jgi:hypothetical protein
MLGNCKRERGCVHRLAYSIAWNAPTGLQGCGQGIDLEVTPNSQVMCTKRMNETDKCVGQGTGSISALNGNQLKSMYGLQTLLGLPSLIERMSILTGAE